MVILISLETYLQEKYVISKNPLCFVTLMTHPTRLILSHLVKSMSGHHIHRDQSDMACIQLPLL